MIAYLKMIYKEIIYELEGEIEKFVNPFNGFSGQRF